MGTNSPEVTEQPKKHCRKLKRKYNKNRTKSKYKSMDDSNEGSSKNDSNQKTESHTVQEKTKVYKPLQLFLDMNLEEYELYHEFKLFVLTKEQRIKNRYPIECAEFPGRVKVDPKLPKDSNRRSCYRCHENFEVENGHYQGGSCQYHPKKRGRYGSTYPCCNGSYLSKGCVTYKCHISTERFLHDVEFLKAREKKYLNETMACKVYALDCEMCYTTNGLEVTRVGIVSIDGLTIYANFVLPENEILDYNTVYSGVTENDLKSVTTTLRDVQAFILKLINKDCILVGHGLENDLKALRLIHDNVVDTSEVFREENGFKPSLKHLASDVLKKNIQGGEHGHDCIEDARTCMELMLWKIHSDLKDRPPVTRDENKNSILQNLHNTFIPAQNSWPYSFNCSYPMDYIYDPSDFYSGYLMPKHYSKQCVY